MLNLDESLSAKWQHMITFLACKCSSIAISYLGKETNANKAFYTTHVITIKIYKVWISKQCNVDMWSKNLVPACLVHMSYVLDYHFINT